MGDNIALDFDRSTCDELFGRKTHFQQESLHTYHSNFFSMIVFLVVGCQRRVWLIDHALVPAQSTAEKDDKEKKSEEQSPAVRETFRSNDCIYTEVKLEDIGPLWQLSDYDKAYDGENHHAFDCCDSLPRAVVFEDSSILRVLACQPAPGRPARPRKPWTKRCHGHPTCEECHPKPVPRVRPSTIENEGSDGSGEISDSDLNLFD